MNRSHIVLAALAVVVLLIGGTVASLLANRDSFTKPEFPVQFSERMALPSADKGEASRRNVYRNGLDGVEVLVESFIDFMDGSTGHVLYRPDGTAQSFTNWYPAAPGETRQVRSRGSYQEDGRHYRYHEYFRADGSMEQAGLRLPDGSYKIQHFREDVQTIAKSQLFDNDGKRYGLEEFYTNGQMMHRDFTESRTRIVERWTMDGTRIYYQFSKTFHDIWEHYNPFNGELVLRFEKADKDNMDGTVTYIYADYNNEDGSENHRRVFDHWRMKVMITLADGTSLVQTWYMKDTQADPSIRLHPENFRLKKVVVSSFQGHEGVTINMADDAVNIRSIELPAPDAESSRKVIHRFFREGIMWKEELKDGSRVLSTTEVDSGAGITHGVSEDFLQQFPYTVPPKVPDDPVYDDD